MESDTPPELIEEVTSLIHRLLEGNLTPDGVARLSVLICGHKELARLYVSYMHLHRLLPRYVAAQDLILADDDLNATMILPALVEEDMAPLSDSLLADEASDIFPPYSMPNQPPRGRDWKRLRWAAAILLPVLAVPVIYKVIQTSSRPSLVQETPRPAITKPETNPIDSGQKSEPVLAAIELSKAVLAGAIDATWTGDQKAVIGEHLPIQPMTLKSGLVQLRFDNGVLAIVHGPAVFEVTSGMQLDLKSGTVSVEVPAVAHNFAVVTPSAKVTDLGTEFGVATESDTGTHVEVFRGKVIAAALAAQPGTAPKTVTRDQAVEVPQDASVVRSAALKRVEFVRPKEFTIIQQASVSAYHRWLAYSYALRHDPQLALYYSFEASTNADVVSNGSLSNLEQFDLTLSTQTPPTPQLTPGRWAEKSGVVFDAAKHERLLLADCPLSKTGRLTVAAWINARSRPTWASIAKSRGDSVDGQFSLGLFDNDGDLVARICQADGTDTVIRQGKQDPIPAGQWVFVAMVADGDHLRLYRDGVDVASTPSGAVISNPVIHSLSIGFQPANDGISTRRQSEAYWNGTIDELAIFHRPLSALEIKQMYEAGKPD